MTSKQVNYGFLGIIILMCLGLVFGAHVVASLISDKSSKLVSLQLQQQSLDQQVSQLDQTNQNIEQYSSLADIAKTIVPQDKNQAEAVREIVKIANNANVPISQISFPKSDLTDTLTTTSTNQSQLNFSQLTQVKGLAGVYSLPITVASDANQPIGYDQFTSFLKQLELNRRTAQVTDISLVPDAKQSGQLTFTLTINEYIKP